MSVADNDAGAKYGEAGKTDITHGVFFHARHSNIAKPAASVASYAESRQNWAIPASWQPRAKAPTTPTSSRCNSSSLKRIDPDTHTSHGAYGTLA
jgi:hypothetical protein